MLWCSCFNQSANQALCVGCVAYIHSDTEIAVGFRRSFDVCACALTDVNVYTGVDLSVSVSINSRGLLRHNKQNLQSTENWPGGGAATNQIVSYQLSRFLVLSQPQRPPVEAVFPAFEKKIFRDKHEMKKYELAYPFLTRCASAGRKRDRSPPPPAVSLFFYLEWKREARGTTLCV